MRHQVNYTDNFRGFAKAIYGFVCIIVPVLKVGTGYSLVVLDEHLFSILAGFPKCNLVCILIQG